MTQLQDQGHPAAGAMTSIAETYTTTAGKNRHSWWPAQWGNYLVVIHRNGVYRKGVFQTP